MTRDEQAQRNRTEAVKHGMQWVLDDLDCLRENGFPNASIARMEAADGWEIGKRDEGPWCEYRPNGVAA